MKLFGIFAIVALAMITSASAQAGVALSNMGADGVTYSNFIDSTNQTATVRNAVGFTVGSSNFTVDTISAGLFGVTPPSSLSSKIGIFSDVGGNPGSLVSESATNSNIQGDGVYSFSFASSAGRVLTAGTTYWVYIDTVGGNLAWYQTTPDISPSDINSTGLLTYVGDKRSTDFNTSRTWSNLATRRTFSIAGTGAPPPAIPEPALTSLLCLGGVALIRRRMKK